LGSFFAREVLVWLQVHGLVSSPPPFLTNTLTQPRFHLKPPGVNQAQPCSPIGEISRRGSRNSFTPGTKSTK
jgi:hypothetical protein